MDKSCRVIRDGGKFDGIQGMSYFSGVSRESTGSEKLCMHLLTLPPGAKSKAHLHEGHESAIYVVSGQVEQLWGHQLENHDVVNAGNYVYIPAGMPHVAMNLSSDPVVAIIARTDPAEQESVVPTPELESVVEAFLASR
jgi:uncharacterized RmlC-like cupin family protein